MDEIRRIATESLLPLLLHWWEWRGMANEAKSHGGTRSEAHRIAMEHTLDEYELFDGINCCFVDCNEIQYFLFELLYWIW